MKIFISRRFGFTVDENASEETPTQKLKEGLVVELLFEAWIDVNTKEILELEIHAGDIDLETHFTKTELLVIEEYLENEVDKELERIKDNEGIE